MSALTIQELTQQITDEEMKTMARIEGLISLRKGLREDQESLEEMVGEVIEQRREEMIALEIPPDVLDEGLQAFSARYEGLIADAQKAQLSAVRMQRK